MKLIIRFGLGFFVMLATLPTLATGGLVTGAASTSGATSSSGGLGGVAYIPSSDSTPVVTSTDTILDSAKEAAATQSKAKKTALIVMGVMAGVAVVSCPSCGTKNTCSVCTASLVGAAAAGLTANQMAAAEESSLNQAADVSPTTTTSTTGETGGLDVANDSTYQSALKDLAQATTGTGYKVANDMGTVSTADGRTIATSGKSSAASGGGLTLGEKSALASVLKQAQDTVAKANLASVPAEELSGGAAAQSASRTKLADETFAAKGATAKRVPASVAGAFKVFNGDKIGVAVDSVFEMMSRRYKHVAEDQNSLLQTK